MTVLVVVLYVCVKTELPVFKKHCFPWHCTHILSITDKFLPVILPKEQSLAVLTALIKDCPNLKYSHIFPESCTL